MSTSSSTKFVSSPRKLEEEGDRWDSEGGSLVESPAPDAVESVWVRRSLVTAKGAPEVVAGSVRGGKDGNGKGRGGLHTPNYRGVRELPWMNRLGADPRNMTRFSRGRSNLNSRGGWSNHRLGTSPLFG